MSMKANRLLIFAMVAALFAGGMMATLAQDANDTAAAPARGRMLQRLAQKLNLTSDQRSQIRAILAADRANLAALLGRLHDARRNLRTAIHAADANETTVRAAAAVVAGAEADLAVERMKLYGKIAPILTDEQRRKIADLEQPADNFADSAVARPGAGADH